MVVQGRKLNESVNFKRKCCASSKIPTKNQRVIVNLLRMVNKIEKTLNISVYNRQLVAIVESRIDEKRRGLHVSFFSSAIYLTNRRDKYKQRCKHEIREL